MDSRDDRRRTNSFKLENVSLPNQRVVTSIAEGLEDPDDAPLDHQWTAGRPETLRSSLRARTIPVSIQPTDSRILRLLQNYWYLLLFLTVLAAIGVHFGVRYGHVQPLAGFITIFLSLLPLAYLLSEVTERLGVTLRNAFVAVLIIVFLSNAVELAFSLVAVSKQVNGLTTQGLLGSAVENIVLGLSGSSLLNACYQKNVKPKNNFLLTSRLQFYFLSANAFVLCILTVFYHFLDDRSRPALHNTFIAYHSITLVWWLVFIIFQTVETRKKRLDESQSSQPYSGRTGSLGLVLFWARKHPALLSVVKLCVTVAALGALSDFLVNDVTAFYHGSSLIPEWVGVILIPIGSNLAEKAIIIAIAIKKPDEWESIICTTVGSAWQIIGFVLPIVYFTGMGLKVNLEDYYDWKLVCLLFVISLLATPLYYNGRNALWKGALLGLVGSALLITVASGKITK